jgi:hypothetical protein
MGNNDALAAIFVFASLSAMVVGVAHYWYKARLLKSKGSTDVEMRLARLEVAIDDMTAEIGRMTESHRFLAAALAQRGLPMEVPRGSE